MNRLKTFSSTVTGGKFKGSKILIPDIPTTRSSKSILRESLFDTLQFDIVGKSFVEVFAGSGSVAIEALSRGASGAYMIEKNSAVYKLLEQNVSSVAATEKYELFLGDSFEIFPSIADKLEKNNEKAYFYFDPPFSIRNGMEEIYTQVISMIASLSPDVTETVIIEHMTKLAMPEQIGKITLYKKKKFGKSSLSYYKFLGEE